MDAIKTVIKRVDKFQQSHRPLAFGYGVIKKYGEDGAGYQAALLTYYGFLALFPLLMVATTLTDTLIGNNSELGKKIMSGLTDYFPLLGDQLSSDVNGIGGNGFALLAGLLFAFYGARGVADVFRRGVHDIWGVPKRDRAGFPKSTLKSLALIVIGGLGFVLASVSAGLATAAGRGWGFRALSIAVNLFILFWLFTFILKFNLPKKVSLKQIRPGAVVFAVGLVILQAVGGYILTRQLKSLDALYSYFAISLGLLFWIYLQAQMVYYAVEIAAVNAKKLWPRSLNEPAKDED